MLTTDEIGRITEEEQLRHKIRKDLSSPKTITGRIWLFLNSSFGIFLLSTVVFGTISTSYAYWKNLEDKKQTNLLELTRTVDEMKFRIQQLDIALSRAHGAATRIRTVRKPAIDGEVGYGSEIFEAIRRFNREVNPVIAVVKQGGLGEIPGTNNDGVVFFREFTVESSMLPFKQGFRFPEYSHLTLIDLTKRMFELKGESQSTAVIDLENRLGGLQQPTYDLLRFQVLRASLDHALSGQEIREPDQLASNVEEMLLPIEQAWKSVKDSPALSSLKI